MAKEKGKSNNLGIDLSNPRVIWEHLVKEYEEKLRVEFKKLSKCDGVNSSFVGACKVILKFKKNDAFGVECIPWAAGEKSDVIETILGATMKEFVANGGYEQYKALEEHRKNAFIDEILLIATTSLMHVSVGQDFWCGTVDDQHIIEDSYEQFLIWVLVFDKEKLEQNLIIDKSAYSFWERLRIEWKHIPIEINKIDFCYNELFRRASLLDDFLRFYENDVNVLSSMRYEGANNTGSIICLLPKWDEDYDELKKVFEVTMEFDSPISFVASNYKKIRKLLEMTSGDLSLLMNNNSKIFALGKIMEDPVCDYCQVKFNGYLNWDYYVNGSKKINFVNMIPMIPDKIKGVGKETEEMIKKTFGESCNLDLIKIIIDEAIEQKHGTMVVFSECAKQEADRLKKYGLRINAVKLEGEVVSSITSIDGALICDPYGYCYAIGIILDGEATEQADSARGARYNSALKYRGRQKRKDINIKTLIVVVSEDGYVDCLSTEIDDYSAIDCIK